MVCILLGTGFEEAEALVPADMLRRAKIEVCMAGVDGTEITGAHGITVKADCPFLRWMLTSWSWCSCPAVWAVSMPSSQATKPWS